MTFEEMFYAIHGYDPFPWQSEAARRLVSGEFFSLLRVPTASGKTAMIDAAVYAAAHNGPRRIAFIIDRRVVVDEAYARAQRIRDALSGPSLSELAECLGPIQVVRLRGGVHGDDDWVLYPDRLTVIISTVDQVGSRLLHRGYGVSPRMAPLHAGFFGNDALYIIDEAHLSMPFIETVESARRYGADIRLIAMTATPVIESFNTVSLSAQDRSHPVLKHRFKATKLAKLEERTSDGTELVKEADFVKETFSAAQQLAKSAKLIGIVVNRVGTARRIWQLLVKAGYCAELLTGRVRPFERDRLMDTLLPAIRAGRIREEEGDPLFIVATQTIEVGADIDFDALVTEAAPLDALRQRFGRLDRFGELSKTQGVILYRPTRDKEGKLQTDPIYGMAIHEAWGWLKKVADKGCVDFGIESIEKQIKQVEAPTIESKHAPGLLPSHIALLGQTGPEAPYINIAPWLHGTQGGSADVSLVWRADLYPDKPDLWPESVQLRPPLTQETMEIPLYAARSWLEGRAPQEVTDIEGVESYAGIMGRSDKPVLRWRGPDDCQVVYSQDIRPGDTLVVPATYGGCDPYGWYPNSTEPVEDIADFCSLEQKNGHVVRLVPDLMGWLGAAQGTIQEALMEVVAAETEVDPEVGIDQDRVDAAREELRHLLSQADHPLVTAFRGRFDIEQCPFGVVLRGRVIDEVNATLNSGVPVKLDRHLEGVARFAESLALSHPERERIVQAARQHDIGKKEPRFQRMLYGNPLAAAASPPLAKSGLRKRSELIAAYTESGLPRGFRHELASIAMLIPPDNTGSDMLVHYLIATHHGYGRPWFPACEDTEAPGVVQVWLGSGWARTFSELFDMYGPWHLAGMELLLRASDARASMAEQEEIDA